MNEQEQHDIEQRLKAITPAEPALRLCGRIHASLAEPPMPAHHAGAMQRRLFVAFALAAAVAIAGLVVVLVSHQPDAPPEVVVSPPAMPHTHADNPPIPPQVEPTLIAFNRALSGSEADVQRLLDEIGKQRATTRTSDLKPAPKPSDAWHQALNREFP